MYSLQSNELKTSQFLKPAKELYTQQYSHHAVDTNINDKEKNKISITSDFYL